MGEGKKAAREQDQKPRSRFSTLFHAAPEALTRNVLYQFAFAVIWLIGCVVLSIVTKMPKFMGGTLVSVWLGYLGLSSLLDYDKGLIKEKVVMCVSVQEQWRKKTVKISAHSLPEKEDETPEYYEFYVSSTKKDQFIPYMTYLAYFRESDPHTLLAYKPL